MLRVRVAKKTIEADEVCSFELVAAGGETLPAFTAGAHLDIRLGSGLCRPYSLCNSPAERHRYLIAVLREAQSRGGSQAMHELQAGDRLDISPPKNHFALAPAARRSLLLAGGIGITPIICMAEQLAAQGDEFELHYCTRSKRRTAFFDRLAAAPFAPRVHFHFDDGDDAQKLQPAAVLGAPEPGTHLYVCGPQGFMDAVLGAARAAGWPEAQLHWEFFSAAPAAPTTPERDGSFEIRLARSGRVLVVPQDRSVIQVLREAGVDVETSCEQGVCGTCLTGVLDGVPDHRDMVLTPAEQAANDRFTPCCSRAKSPVLVLDL